MPVNKVLQIIGSPRSGKTSAALGLAKMFNAIIIFPTNLDTGQAYSMMVHWDLKLVNHLCYIYDFIRFINRGTYPCNSKGEINIILDGVSLEEFENLKRGCFSMPKINLIAYTKNSVESEEK